MAMLVYRRVFPIVKISLEEFGETLKLRSGGSRTFVCLNELSLGFEGTLGICHLSWNDWIDSYLWHVKKGQLSGESGK